MPYFIIVKLFFALFGLSSERDVNLTPENPDNIKYFQVYLFFRVNFTHHFITSVCIHSVPTGYNDHPDKSSHSHDVRHLPENTGQLSWQQLSSIRRIFFSQQQSDMEWKFGRSKLITWVRIKMCLFSSIK